MCSSTQRCQTHIRQSQCAQYSSAMTSRQHSIPCPVQWSNSECCCYTSVHSLINYVISGFLCINKISINPTKKNFSDERSWFCGGVTALVHLFQLINCEIWNSGHNWSCMQHNLLLPLIMPCCPFRHWDSSARSGMFSCLSPA